jgi:hypothetical protein
MPSGHLPPPWRLEELPAGFRIVDGRGVALVYVYSADDDVRSATPGVTLSRPEAVAICKLILRFDLAVAPAPLRCRPPRPMAGVGRAGDRNAGAYVAGDRNGPCHSERQCHKNNDFAHSRMPKSGRPVGEKMHAVGPN